MAFGSQNNKRRRRRRSENALALPQTVRATRSQQLRFQTGEIVTSLGVAIIAVALIALAWINESRAVSSERSELRSRIEAAVTGQARVLAEEVRRELLGIDQSLKQLKLAYEAHPMNFDIQAWKEQVPVLADASNSVFVANAQGIIQNDTKPASVGLGVGANVGNSSDAESEDAGHNEGLIVGATTERIETRQHVTYMLMRLTHPGGWFVGATYRTDALTQLFAAASLGLRGMTALVNTQIGRVQAVSGPAASVRAYDINDTAMMAAMRERPDGFWIGPSALDNVQRIHGFSEIPGRKLTVVVAVDAAVAMEPAETWASNARWVAWGATLVILLGAAVTLQFVWTQRAARRLRQTVERERSIVVSTQTDLSDIKTRLESRTAQLQMVFGVTDAGILLLDRELRAVEWNPRLPILLGVDPAQLQAGPSLDALLRSQADRGAFGAIEDVEAEVARRLALLRRSGAGETLFMLAHGCARAVQSRSLPDGGLLVLVRELTDLEALPAVARVAPADTPARILEQPPAAGRVETL